MKGKKSKTKSSSRKRQGPHDAPAVAVSAADEEDYRTEGPVEKERSRKAQGRRLREQAEENLIQKMEQRWAARERARKRTKERGDHPPPVNMSTARTPAPMWAMVNPAAGIRNKERRARVFQEWKRAKRLLKDQRRAERVEERERLGDAAPPKLKPITQEDKRTPDLSMVEENDQEILKEEEEDEFSDHYKGKTTPKIMITTCADHSPRMKLFIDELLALWPHAEFHCRKGFPLKAVTRFAIEAKFTDLVVITQQFHYPKMMILSHLPKGPTATFRISTFMAAKDIPDAGLRTKHAPELIFKNFSTRIGRRISRMLGATFKLKPDLHARGVVTLHNQRDFIFVRVHRYIFDSLSKVRLQELGPRFTLRLRSLQHGLFDTKFGEWEWAYHKKEMGGKDRLMFNL